MMAFFSDNLVSGFSCHIESLAGFLCAFFMSVENKEHVVSEPQVSEYWNQTPAETKGMKIMKCRVEVNRIEILRN